MGARVRVHHCGQAAKQHSTGLGAELASVFHSWFGGGDLMHGFLLPGFHLTPDC